jgi:hypothetical protein
MPTIEALRDAIDVLRRNPVLFAAGAVNAVIVLPQTVLSILGVPILPGLIGVVTFFITPFVLAGTIGMAFEGLSGETAFGTFVDGGKDSYLSMLGGSLVQLAIAIAFGVVFAVTLALTIGVAVLGAGASAGAGGSPELLGGVGAATALLVGAAVLVFGLLFLTVMFLIQLFPPAVVVEDRGAIGSIKRSYAVVRDNLVPALGYSAIVIAIGIVVAIPTFLASLASQGPAAGALDLPIDRTAAAAAGVGITLVAGVVIYPFQQAFATAFFVRHTDGGDDTGPTPDDTVSTDAGLTDEASEADDGRRPGDT